MKAKYASEIRSGIELARADQRWAVRFILTRGVPELTYKAYSRTYRRDTMAGCGCNRWEY